MAQALLFNMTGEKKKKLRVQLTMAGVAPRDVLAEDCGRTLGALLHPDRFPDAAPVKAEPFSDEMLVLDGLSPQQLRALLDGLRRAKVTVALKAVTTEENLGWSAAKLHRELSAEHEALTGGGPAIHGAGRR